MGGLANICKQFGKVETIGADGKKVVWVWDEKQNKPVIKQRQTKQNKPK